MINHRSISEVTLRNFTLCIGIFVVSLFGQGCEKDDLVAIRSIETFTPVVTGNVAVTGGKMIANREIELIDYGVCLSTRPNPTIDDLIFAGTDMMVSQDSGSYTVEFTSQIAPLSAGTRYYLRAYVNTKSGRAYGTQIDFTTD